MLNKTFPKFGTLEVFLINKKTRMPQNWKIYKLEEVAKIRYGKDHKKLEEGSIPCYGTGGIMRYVDKFLSEEESVLIPRKGSLNNLYHINKPFWTVDTLFWTQIDSSKIFPKFLYYNFKTIDFASKDVGSAVPSLTTSLLNKVEILIPPLPEQKAIASILSALDDKIELNLQMNKTLEEMAMALYKHWFVDFGPFQNGEFVDSELGLIPEGWEVKQLEDILEIKYGKDHKKLEEGNIPCYGTGGIMRYVEKSLYDKDSILIPRKGSLNNLYYMTQPFWTVDTLFYSKIKMKHFGKYCFHFLKTLDLASMDVGSAIPSLTTQLLKRIKLIVPQIDEIKKFDAIVTLQFNTIESNKIENQTLTQLRDTLLPKLISGEVSVKDLEEEISQVL